MTTLVSELIRGVQDMIQDINPPFRRWPEKEVVRAVNYGCRAIYKYLPIVSTRKFAVLLKSDEVAQEVALIPATRIRPIPVHDFEVAAFVRATANMGADGQTRGRAIRAPVDRNCKDAFDPDWQTKSGLDVREIIFSKDMPTRFDVSPKPIGDRWIEIEAMVMPREIPGGGAPGSEIYAVSGANTEVIPLPVKWIEDLQHYVAALLLLKGSKDTQNLVKASTHTQAFLASLNAQAQAQTGVNPNLKSLPFSAEIA